jgi:hypothetical protein
MTVPCTNNTKVLDGVLDVLDAHGFVFAWLIGLADALGCAYSHSTFVIIKYWFVVRGHTQLEGKA